MLHQLHWTNTSQLSSQLCQHGANLQAGFSAPLQKYHFPTYRSTSSAVQFLCCIFLPSRQHLDSMELLTSLLLITSCCPVQPFLEGPHPRRQTCLCEARPTLGFVRQVLGMTKVGSFTIRWAHLWKASTHRYTWHCVRRSWSELNH